MRAQIRRIDSRLHLQDGPIDLIVEAFGDDRGRGLSRGGGTLRHHSR